MTSKIKHHFKWALVTGASSGIGRELCHLLASYGINLIITARSTDQLQSLAMELKDQVNVDIVIADLASAKERALLIDKIYERLPELVINNAGYGYYGEALSYETAVSMDLLQVDVAALLEISLEAARALVSASKKGTIMNVSSSAAFHIFPNFSLYAASKAFVNSFSESFDEEMRLKGVRVLACCPGMVDTNFRNRASSGKSSEPNPSSMSVQFAAEEIWWQIQKGKGLHAFDWRYRLGNFLGLHFLPRRIMARFLRKSLTLRTKSREIIKRTK